MAWTAITSAQTDADTPIDQTLMDLIRTNDADNNSRINALTATSNLDIRDDFLGNTATIDLNYWDIGSGSAPDDPKIVSEHQAELSPAGGAPNFSAMAADDAKIDILMTEGEYVCIVEFRVKNVGTDADHLHVGMKDIAMSEATLADTADSSDFVGIVNGGGADWIIRVSNTASGGNDREGQGTQASWTKFKFTITCSTTGANQKVEIDVNDASSGAAMTTNIPATRLRPWISAQGVTGTRDLRVDYFLCHFEGRPLSN